jgi:hypothetical protein
MEAGPDTVASRLASQAVDIKRHGRASDQTEALSALLRGGEALQVEGVPETPFVVQFKAWRKQLLEWSTDDEG